MTTEQMIAWLTLEGYEPYQSPYWTGCSNGKMFYLVYLDERKGTGCGVQVGGTLAHILAGRKIGSRWGDPYEVAELYERVVNDVRD